jgi:hypothetical protein
MDQDVARIVLGSLTAVGAVVWLMGLQFLLTTFRGQRSREPEAFGELDFDREDHEGWLAGSTEVEGEAPALASRAAAILIQGNLGALGPVKILDKAPDRIRFERVGMGAGRGSPGQWFRRGELRFTPVGAGRTEVAWAFETAAMRRLLWAGLVIEAAGLIALVVGCWAISTYVIPSPNPGVRWQTVQMVQVVHFLWPPFLMGGLYRKGVAALATQFEALASNLAFYERPG